MKIIKKISVILACMLAFSFGACNSEEELEWLTPPTGKSISVIVTMAGFGADGISAVAEAFRQKTGHRVYVNESYLRDEVSTLLQSDGMTHDVIFSVDPLAKFESLDKFVDLSDVYDTIPAGEDETIRQKINPGVLSNVQREDDKIYQMPWIDSVNSITYNKTTLDEIFPNGYDLPRTTDELIDFSKEIAAKDTYAFSFATDSSYMMFAWIPWWVQYGGLQEYSDYFKGYYDNNGVRTKAENAETLDLPGRLKALEVACELWSRDKGLAHQYSASMSFLEAQIAFVGHGYKNSDMKKCAMMINGDWLENEMASYLSVKPQELRMMKLPVISAITETLEDKTMSDATLSAVIDVIDAGETSYQGVSPNDFKRIQEARNMVNGSASYHCAMIPTSSTKQDLAKEFLTFMASDEGQKAFSDAMFGLTGPYGYIPDEARTSAFVKSRREMYGANYTLIAGDYASPLVINGELREFGMVSDGDIFKGDSARTVLNAINAKLKTNWQDIIRWAE